MKYENKEAFEQVNMFGTGTPNTAYSKFFIGDAFLNPLTDPKGSLFAANVTFEPACRNNWHIITRLPAADSSFSAPRARAGIRKRARTPSACTRAASS